MAEVDDVQNLIRIHKRRLALLEEQRAVYGYSAPPHVLMEIDDIKAELERLNARLAVLEDEAEGEALNTHNQSCPNGSTNDSAGKPQSLREVKLAALEQRRADLIEEYQAASRGLSSALGDVERMRLKRQLQALEQQIADVEAEIAALA